MNFSNKYVLVTGGSRGIGRAVARAFANHSACVAISYKTNQSAAEETIQSLPNGPHLAFRADVAKPDEVRQLVDNVFQKFGRLDIVVNNAGVHEFHPIDEVDYNQWQEAWQQTLAVNLFGPANVCYCAAQYMIKSGGGRIVNISSRGAFRGEPEMPAYGASKAGLNAMSQSLAQKLAKFNIFVGVVAPGFVETDMAAELLAGPKGDGIRNQSPLGRVARPEEVAQAVLFLAAEGSEFMTGAIIDVNGASYLRS
ncbi:MAG: SDR family NAD(P)-dependent oxidoreductase [Candidatus Aminicenantes bacterium]|nr:SDR family NAD(P)-dependent oxidoreductase [Candidatus Aminicenantes bacterium]